MGELGRVIPHVPVSYHPIPITSVKLSTYQLWEQRNSLSGPHNNKIVFFCNFEICLEKGGSASISYSTIPSLTARTLVFFKIIINRDVWKFQLCAPKSGLRPLWSFRSVFRIPLFGKMERKWWLMNHDFVNRCWLFCINCPLLQSEQEADQEKQLASPSLQLVAKADTVLMW